MCILYCLLVVIAMCSSVDDEYARFTQITFVMAQLFSNKIKLARVKGSLKYTYTVVEKSVLRSIVYVREYTEIDVKRYCKIKDIQIVETRTI